MLADGQADPVRVRACWVDDAEIAWMAQRFAPPAGEVFTLDDLAQGWTPDVDGWAA